VRSTCEGIKAGHLPRVTTHVRTREAFGWGDPHCPPNGRNPTFSGRPRVQLLNLCNSAAPRVTSQQAGASSRLVVAFRMASISRLCSVIGEWGLGTGLAPRSATGIESSAHPSLAGRPGAPTVFSCLAALASLKTPAGPYQCDQLEPRLAPADLDRRLRTWHDQAFACWLSMTLVQQAAELRTHIAGSVHDSSSLLSSHRSLIPAAATRPEIDLYDVDLRLSLSMLGEAFHSGLDAPAHKHSLTLLKAVKLSGGAISLSLKELGTTLGMTPNHLGRTFQAHVGLPFREYLRLVRLGRIAYLLRYSCKPVKHLAAEAGYPDASNFVHDFKVAFGKSPNMYRTDVDQSAQILPQERSLILTIARPAEPHLDCDSDTPAPGNHNAPTQKPL